MELAHSGRWSAYPDGVIDIAAIKVRFEGLEPVLDERERRLFAASEARAAGHGGGVAVSRATGDCPQHDRSRPLIETMPSRVMRRSSRKTAWHAPAVSG